MFSDVIRDNRALYHILTMFVSIKNSKILSVVDGPYESYICHLPYVFARWKIYVDQNISNNLCWLFLICQSKKSEVVRSYTRVYN